MRSDLRLSKLDVSPKLFWRRNEDEFKIEIGETGLKTNTRRILTVFKQAVSSTPALGRPLWESSWQKKILKVPILATMTGPEAGFLLSIKYFQPTGW